MEKELTDRLVPAVVAEILRLELARVEEELDTSYTDGGRETGERRKRLINVIREAYDIAREAMDGYR